MTNVFDKLLYGLKVANDNIIVVNEKLDALMRSLSYEENEPNDTFGSETIEGI